MLQSHHKTRGKHDSLKYKLNIPMTIHYNHNQFQNPCPQVYKVLTEFALFTSPSNFEALFSPDSLSHVFSCLQMHKLGLTWQLLYWLCSQGHTHTWLTPDCILTITLSEVFSVLQFKVFQYLSIPPPYFTSLLCKALIIDLFTASQDL